jgi:hypothetical protein
MLLPEIDEVSRSQAAFGEELGRKKTAAIARTRRIRSMGYTGVV